MRSTESHWARIQIRVMPTTTVFKFSLVEPKPKLGSILVKKITAFPHLFQYIKPSK